MVRVKCPGGDRPKPVHLDVDKFRSARKVAGYTQIGLARKMERGDNFIVRIENGAREISLEDYLTACRLLGIEINVCLA